MAGMQYGFGSGVLYGIRNDIANATPVRFGVLQDVQIEFNAEVKTLFGQLQYPVDIARGKAKITGKAKIGLLSPLLFNNLYFGQTNVAGQKLFAYGESRTFATSVLASLVTGGVTFDTDLGPMYATTGLPLTLVSSAPTAGQYTINTSTGTYTFNAGDTGTVLLNYTATTTASGFTMANTNLLMGTTPKFQAVFNQTYSGNTTTLKLFSCVASKLTFPTKMDDYVIPEIDFEAFSNSAGNVFELSMSGT
jgi:hypothetical protein